MPGLVDDAHAAAPQHRLDVVAGDLGEPSVRRPEGPVADPVVGNNESTWASQLANAPQAITDLGQQLRAGPTHLLRCAIAIRGSPRAGFALVDRPT